MRAVSNPPVISVLDGNRGIEADVYTDRGNPVRAWFPDTCNFPDQQFFCHGISLNTYYLYGYSVMGACIPTVLNDEYTKLNSLNDIRDGDIIVFSSTPNRITAVHSARFLDVVRNPDNTIDARRTILVSKSSFAPRRDISLYDEMRAWATNSYSLYRRR